MELDVAGILIFSLRSATLSTSLVFIAALPSAYFLSQKNIPGKNFFSALLGVPLVLPPTAVGFLLLKLFSDYGWLGQYLSRLNISILLSWKAVVIASGLMSFPLVFRTLKIAFDGVNKDLILMHRSLGYSPRRSFFGLTLPLIRYPMAAAFLLGFTRALGEFGATVTIAGNIPGKTQTLASAIYSAGQNGHDAVAYMLMVFALLAGFAAIYLSELFSKKYPGAHHGG